MTLQETNPTPPTNVPVSVTILTYNEEKNILACLESCRWCDDVHVLDSGSTDRTQEMARQWGATVHEHMFATFGLQRNWAIDNIPSKYLWHFHLDADERFTPELVAEMLRLLGPDGKNSRQAAYFVPSKLMFRGKWLRHSGSYPTYQVRFFNSCKCRFVDFGHGQREDCTGEIGWMVNPYLHYSFSKGMADWFLKHNDYSNREALEAVTVRRMGLTFSGLGSRDALTRRRTLKNLTFFLKARALFRFIYMYMMNGGWLDAAPGFHHCMMMASYEYWIELKIREQELGWTNRTTSLADRMLDEGRRKLK
jgi:glycosyltransferase involved in cell wall biosynthesis